MSVAHVLKRPSALVPIAMSFTALCLVAATVAIYGVVREADEGTAAHLFQLLIAGQVPIVGYFAVTAVPECPREGLVVLALQALAILVAFAPVFALGL